MAEALFGWYNSLVTQRTILITGVVSLLGAAAARVLSSNHRVIGTFHRSAPPADLATQLTETIPLDITQANEVKQLVNKIAPDVILHLAAISDIDYCETHRNEAHRLNVVGTKHIAAAAEQAHAHLIFLSSSMVFSGTSAPYDEAALPEPVNMYGRTKYEAEQLITKKLKKFTIVRSASLFGWEPEPARTNDLTFYLPLLKQNKPLHLVNDRFFNPLSAITAAQAIRKIIEEEKFGIYHIGGFDRVSRYTLMQKIAGAFKIKPINLTPVPSSFFPNLAPRPVDSTLTTEKMKAELGISPPTLKQEFSRLAQEKIH